jgi:sugar phosphate isomerase/epimerase
MLNVRIGIQLASLRLPFKKALHTAARLGAEAVEIDARGDIKPQDLSRTAVRQLRKLLEDLNLRVCAVTFRTRRGYNVADDLERRIEATKQAMQMAYELGASVVVNQIGRIPEKPEGAEWDLLLQSLSDLGRHGQHVGATLAAETGSESSADLARLIAALPIGSIGVTFDPANLIVNGFSPRDALAAIGSHILHVHAKDAVRDLAQRRGLEVPLGRGSVDFPELLGALEERGYRGYLTIERDKCDDPIGEIGQAVEYLRSL